MTDFELLCQFVSPKDLGLQFRIALTVTRFTKTGERCFARADNEGEADIAILPAVYRAPVNEKEIGRIYLFNKGSVDEQILVWCADYELCAHLKLDPNISEWDTKDEAQYIVLKAFINLLT